MGTLTHKNRAYGFQASATDLTSLFRADTTTGEIAGWIHVADEVRGSCVLAQSPRELFERMLPAPSKIDGAFAGLLFLTPITPDNVVSTWMLLGERVRAQSSSSRSYSRSRGT